MANASHSSPRAKIQQVIAHKPGRGRAFSLLYLLPALFLSALFHAGLLGAMYLSGSPLDTESARQAKKEADDKLLGSVPPPVTATPPEPEEDEPEAQQDDKLITPPPDDPPPIKEKDEDPDVLADFAVPGVQKPGEKIGIEGGAKDVSPFDIAPPSSPFGDGMGQGGAIDKSLEGGLGGLLGSPGGGFGDIKGMPIAGGFDGRSGAAKAEALKQGGGTEESEAAVARGLLFLARMQQPDGRWRLDAPTINLTEMDKSTRKVKIPDPGHTVDDVAGTALGLLPFLAAGKTHKENKDNPFDKPIEKALAYLMRRQDKKTGKIGAGTMYSHGLATIALCEAYGLTRDQALRKPAQDAINYIVFAQAADGGWRYGPGQPGDTSVVGWQVMALKSGQLARLEVPDATITKAIRFLDKVCDTNNEGYGYAGKGSSPTMSAVGLLCRQYIQFWGPNNARMVKGIDTMIKPHPPSGIAKGKRGSATNMYYYYYATQVMHHFGGEAWKNWNEKMRDQLVDTQVKEGDLAGSWDAVGDPHGHAGGRLMVTSLSLLTLEVYYRHLPLFNQQ